MIALSNDDNGLADFNKIFENPQHNKETYATLQVDQTPFQSKQQVSLQESYAA